MDVQLTLISEKKKQGLQSNKRKTRNYTCFWLKKKKTWLKRHNNTSCKVRTFASKLKTVLSNKQWQKSKLNVTITDLGNF